MCQDLLRSVKRLMPAVVMTSDRGRKTFSVTGFPFAYFFVAETNVRQTTSFLSNRVVKYRWAGCVSASVTASLIGDLSVRLIGADEVGSPMPKISAML